MESITVSTIVSGKHISVKTIASGEQPIMLVLVTQLRGTIVALIPDEMRASTLVLRLASYK